MAASAGRYNTLVLDDAGTLYAWGLDGCATEGEVPARGEAWKARPVGGELAGKRVVAFDSGGCRGWWAIVDGGCGMGAGGRVVAHGLCRPQW